MTVLPNLVVIGAGKCGTSALHHYLRAHPEVFMTWRKELQFFSGRHWDLGLDWYASWFEGATEPVRGESSPQYTGGPSTVSAAERMHAVLPDARLIYLVRDPIERVVSALANRSAHGETIAPVVVSGDERWLQASRYATQLERYLAHYPAEQILVIDRDDLLSRRRETLRAVFRFLGIDETFESPRFDELRNVGATKRRMRFTAPLLPRSTEPAPTGRLPWAIRKRLKDVLLRPLTVPVEPPRLTAGQRAKLETLLAPEAERLRALTGKAFAGWSV